MKTSRPTLDVTGLRAALIWAERGTCKRRKVGCVLVNGHGHTLATGYNGRPSGWPHCYDEPCPGAHQQSGTALNFCEAIHAEANALLQCKNVMEVYTAYCTTAPCVECVKLLLNTSCTRIVFLEDYPHSKVSRERWERRGAREWLHLPDVSLG